MPRLSRISPKYRKHKPTGQAVVTLGVKDHYLGPHGSVASRKEYDRLIQEWMANGRTAPTDAADLTIAEVLVAYLRFAKGYYGASGEYENMLYAVKPLRKLYCQLPAAEFGPLKLSCLAWNWKVGPVGLA